MLARSLLPALERPAGIPALFVDQVFSALRTHLLSAHCGLNPVDDRLGPKLTAWQVSRIKEMLLDDRGADRSVAELAAACGLSDGHFTRAFGRTLGTSQVASRTRAT